MAVEEKLQFDEAYIRQFATEQNEPAWMVEKRVKALELANLLPMLKLEKTKIDNWNFTQFHHKTEQKNIVSRTELPKELQSLLGDKEQDQNILVQQNGQLVYMSVSEELKNKGVIFTDMKTALKEHADLLEKYYMTEAVKESEHRLTALHAALMNAGTFIYVPKNVVVEVPLQIIYHIDDKKYGLMNHVLVVAETSSSVQVVEEYIAAEDVISTANVIVEAIAEENANIVYAAVDQFSKDIVSYMNRRGIAKRDAKIHWALGQMNDGHTVSDNTTYLEGDASYTDTKTVAIGRGEQKLNFVSRVYHLGKGSESNMVSHGVMKDSATAIFNGITKIEHGASKSNGEQTERVLMLSEKARGDANPILLIDEDDVMAGHAATVGRVDDVQLYYLMSRGINRQEAERLIIHGFLNSVVKELPIEEVRNRLVDAIERKVQ